MGSVGPVQFHIVPCSSLYLFSRSIGPLQCLVNINYRVLICCTCHFQSCSLFGSLCLQVSLVFNFHPDIKGQSGHLHRLTCLAVLWRGRDVTKNTTGVCGKCFQQMGHIGLATAQSNVYFPGPHCSDSRVLCEGTVPHGPCISCTSQV